jgi:MFS family permease
MTVRSNTPVLRSNIRSFYFDTLWAGVLTGSTLSFLAVYLTRIGASTFQIGLLTAGPALVNLLFSLPAGRWLERRGLISTAFWTLAMVRLGYLLIVMLPWLFGDSVQVWAVVLITLLMALPGTFFAISFNAMFAEVIPAEWRAEVVGKRNAIVAIAITGTTLLCGQLLDRIPSPLNYQLVFAIGAVGAVMSTYYVGKLKSQASDKPAWIFKRSADHSDSGEEHLSPGAEKPSSRTGSRSTMRVGLREYLHLDLIRSPYGLFMASYLVFYTFQYLGIPLVPAVQVNILKLSDGIISLGSSLFYLTMFLISLRMVWISTRFGHHKVLTYGALWMASYPFLLGVANGPALFWVASVMGGGAWGMASAGLVNRLMERVPAENRPGGMAVHNVVLNLGILLGSLGAPLVGAAMGAQNGLILTGVFRFLAGLLFRVWG